MPSRQNRPSTCINAVVIRSAPGDPIASTGPMPDGAPVARPTVGDMFEARRVPGVRACRPSRLSSGSPRQLFSMRPVPGTVAPEPYPAEAVIAHAVPAASTTDT